VAAGLPPATLKALKKSQETSNMRGGLGRTQALASYIQLTTIILCSVILLLMMTRDEYKRKELRNIQQGQLGKSFIAKQVPTRSESDTSE
jgi:hypothetical protein